MPSADKRIHMRRLRILTWHVHGNYLWYLSQARHDFYLPVRPETDGGYGGRGTGFPFGDNVHDIPADEVQHRQFDCILFQTRRNFEKDQFEILSSSQQDLPRIYLEHDPPQQHPTNSKHWVDDPNILLVHATPFNALMWDSGITPSRVIEHGVIIQNGTRYSGEKKRGIVVINHLGRRGRRLGVDVFQRVRAEVPLDLIGMESAELGGLGVVAATQLPAVIGQYRFFFNPIRYTSLGLAVIEAMMIGMPVVGLATTEMATAIQNGMSGFIDTDVGKLIAHMRMLLKHPEEARRLGARARKDALERFNIERFVRDWEAAFAEVTSLGAPLATSEAL
jgi:glycosyltransferase involved in cell wall biosynthesis